MDNAEKKDNPEPTQPEKAAEPVKGYTGPHDTPEAACLSIVATLLSLRDMGDTTETVIRESLLTKHTPEECDKILATMIEQKAITITDGIVSLTLRGVILSILFDLAPAPRPVPISPFRLSVATSGPLKGRAMDPLPTCEECGGRGMHKAQCSARRPGTALA